MPRRVTLPGADELFRATGQPGRDRAGIDGDDLDRAAEDHAQRTPEVPDPETRRVTRPAGQRQPSGRERHAEKITVYVSPSELVDLEHARLMLRAEHALGVDRGRIVREALAVVLADLEAKGEASILVRRLRNAPA
jgi:hypothetical protein